MPQAECLVCADWASWIWSGSNNRSGLLGLWPASM